MGGVAKRTEIRVMRRHDHHAASGSKQPVELLHGADHVANVLDHMNRPDFGKRTVAKRKRIVVQICYNVGLCIWISINADRAWIFVDTATDVEY